MGSGVKMRRESGVNLNKRDWGEHGRVTPGRRAKHRANSAAENTNRRSQGSGDRFSVWTVSRTVS
jgi:hypothetical protein